jgi:arylsulfatase A-like enzyme
MNRHKNESMFLYYAMCLTHTPFTGTPSEPWVHGKIEQHRAMVRYTDHLVGRLVKALDLLAIRDRTIVFVTSDNGTARGISGRMNGRVVAGGKSLTTENGICVPFIVNGPGLVPQGIKTDALTDFTDFMPTCADFAGIQLPEDAEFDGVSIANLLLGKSDDSDRQWIMAMGGGNHARLTDAGVENMYIFRDRVLRNKRYKLFVDSRRKSEKLVDLIVDPDESENLLDRLDENSNEAYEFLRNVVRQFPKKDADPIYLPLPPQPWDVEIRAESKVWKIQRQMQD